MVERARRPMRVAVLEDDPVLVALIEQVLVDSGFLATSWADPVTALAALSGSNGAPDVILADLHMPTMDGMTFIRAYRAGTERPAPVIVVSGGDEMGTDGDEELGIVARLPKPFNLDELIALVRRTCLGETETAAG